MRLSTIICVLACVGLAIAPARAHAEGPRELRYDTRIDVAVTAVGGVWWLTSELLKPALVPEKCRWCYRGEDGTDLLNPVDRTVRRALLWENTGAARWTSSAIAFVIEPVAMMGLTAASAGYDKSIRGFSVDALLITEATIIAADVNQLAKYAFARERPFVHFLPRAPDAVRAVTSTPSDDNLSFFSGHTTLAFALATSTGMITSLRAYRLAPVVWATGMTMAASVGYLRIAADAHYFSDVMTGAIVGSVIGVGIPLLFHTAVSTDAAAAPPSASGQALTGPPMRTAFSMSGAW